MDIHQDETGGLSMTSQDASGAAGIPLGVFLNGTLICVVPADDIWGLETRKAVIAERGPDFNRSEVLLICHLHPTIAAVDCLDCDPI